MKRKLHWYPGGTYFLDYSDHHTTGVSFAFISFHNREEVLIHLRENHYARDPELPTFPNIDEAQRYVETLYQLSEE